MAIHNWRPGDVVSLRAGVDELAIGKVIELHRHSDNAPFLMVEITGGRGVIGRRVYPDAARWLLGTGPHEVRCANCGDEFRAPDLWHALCPACDRAEGETVHAAETQADAHVRVRWKHEDRGGRPRAR